MASTRQEPIVVGVDGSDEANQAVIWAARQAAPAGLPLRILHVLVGAFVWPSGITFTLPPDGVELRAEAGRVTGSAVRLAHAAAPELSVTGDVVVGNVSETLVTESRHADMVVLGSRGLGGFTGLLLGSTGVQTAAHAHCPVVVVRQRHGDSPAPRRVVVGVDGSIMSDLALQFAFEQADLHRAELTALHAWTAPVPAGPGDMLPVVFDKVGVQDEKARLLAAAVTGWQEKFPDVAVTQQVVHDQPAHALIHSATDTDLIVVGARGRGGFTGLLLGSVSQRVLHHASCTVAVVRNRPR